MCGYIQISGHIVLFDKKDDLDVEQERKDWQWTEQHAGQ